MLKVYDSTWATCVPAVGLAGAMLPAARRSLSLLVPTQLSPALLVQAAGGPIVQDTVRALDSIPAFGAAVTGGFQVPHGAAHA
ncbi:MAG TPA: hypothetical protein DEQ43_24070 [Nocardioides bacterium]|nr:hypothetical protein [Nocardioides sp.]